MIRRHVLYALSLLLTAGAHAATPSTLHLERTLGDERFQEDAEIETILPLDDHRVVTLSYGAAVKVWDRDSGKLLAWTRPDGDEGIIDVLPLPGSDRLVLATPSQGHFLWRPGHPPELLPATNEVTSCIAWHPAGFIADIGESGEVQLVDPAHPERAGFMTTDHPIRLGVFTPDGKRLVGVRTEDGTLCAWNFPPPPGRDPDKPGEPLPTLEIRQEARAAVSSWSQSPDGSRVVVVEENNGLALVETAPGLRELWHVEVADMNIGRTAWAPDGSWIALTSGDGNLYRVDPKDGSRKLFAALPGEGNEAAAFSRDGKFLYTGTDGGRLCIFDTATGRLLNPAAAGSKTNRDEMDVSAAVLTRDERAVWMNGRGGILEVPLDGGPVRKIAGSDDIMLLGRAGTNLVLAAGEQTCILDDSGKITGSFEDDKALALQVVTKLIEPLNARPGPAFHAWLCQSTDGFDRGNDLLTGFDFSPDGRLAVFFDSLDNTLALWDLVRDRRVPLPLPEEFYPEQVGFSPVDPNTFYVTDAEDLLVFDLHPGRVEGAITPEEFAAALQRLSSGRFREREDGSHRLKAGGSATLALLKTTAPPDDPEVAGRLEEIRETIETALVPATTLRTTDVSQLPYTMDHIVPLTGGLLVATRSAGVMLFRLRDGVIEILSFLKTPSQATCLTLSRDGRRVVTGNANGTVSVFRLE